LAERSVEALIATDLSRLVDNVAGADRVTAGAGRCS